jgi:xylose isomerase
MGPTPFEVRPQLKFAFGLPRRAPSGAPTSSGVEPWEFVERLGDIGVWAVGFADDDLVPSDASTAERDDIVHSFAKALDSAGVVVSMTSTDLSRHPVFDHGAFTSADRDVRRYAIRKTMRAIDLGAEFGADVHALSGGRQSSDSVATQSPRDCLDRYREAVDFLCGYVRDQHYSTRFALTSTPNERSDAILPTISHALAFIDTLQHPEMVGLNSELLHGTFATPGGYLGLVQATDTNKLFHVVLNAQAGGRHDQDPGFAASVSDGFFLVKLLADTGYDGPLHFDVDPSLLGGADGIGDVALGWMHTYEVLASKVRRFADDPEIRDALAESGALELSEPSVGPFSVEAGRALSTERFDPQAMAQRHYCDQRLHQLVIDLVLGLR